MLYAAYGSNLHPVRLALRLPGSRLLGTAAVANKALCFHKLGMDRSAKCNVIDGEGAVHVAIYEVTEQEKTLLDEIEGVNFGYSVLAVHAPGFGECFTYAATPSHIDDRLRPYTWYKELVLVGCEALLFPQDYVEQIRNTAANEDPDWKRHERNMRLARRARESENGARIIRKAIYG